MIINDLLLGQVFEYLNSFSKGEGKVTVYIYVREPGEKAGYRKGLYTAMSCEDAPEEKHKVVF